MPPSSPNTIWMKSGTDHRISSFEQESARMEHEAVTEVAVVPSPDPVRLAVPKACIFMKSCVQAGPVLA